MRSGKAKWTALIAAMALTLSGCDFSVRNVVNHSGGGSCAEAQLDLAETAIGLWLHSGRISVGPFRAVSFRIKDNHFDPCAKLSWVTIETYEHDKEDFPDINWDLAQTGVLFFHYDRLVTNANMYAAAKVGEIKVSGDKITVEYFQSRAGESSQDIKYELVDEHLEQQDPMRLRIPPLKLDFHRAPPPTEVHLKLYGNVNYRPWTAELELDPYRSPVVNIPMGDRNITCSFPGSNGLEGPNFNCSDRSSSWPRVAVNQSETSAVAGPNGKTNTIHMYFGIPATMFSRYYDYPGSGVTSANLPDEALIKAGGYYIDTRGDTVKIAKDATTVVLGVGRAEMIYEPLIQVDTSRYPQLSELAEWID
jgi:hypothetical protein